MNTTGELLKAANVKGVKRAARKEARRAWLAKNADVKLSGIAAGVAAAFIVIGTAIITTAGKDLRHAVGTYVICVGVYVGCLMVDLLICTTILKDRR